MLDCDWTVCMLLWWYDGVERTEWIEIERVALETNVARLVSPLVISAMDRL